jgi:2-polyprenyl-3-methyl-5-hydroxy-6-metoxy-1,4-benzoquinol methylase
MSRVDNAIFYKNAIDKYGYTPKGVHWNSKKTQYIRFKAIRRMLPDDISNSSLIDAGCGFGDFYTWLQQQNIKFSSYIGIDILDEMVDIAKKNTSQKILKADICKDSVVDADYYICSGAMNVLDKFETHLFIQKCYSSCKYAFVFNILYGTKISQTYNYMTKYQIQKIAKELKVKTMKTDTSYLKNDITVAFYK